MGAESFYIDVVFPGIMPVENKMIGKSTRAYEDFIGLFKKEKVKMVQYEESDIIKKYILDNVVDFIIHTKDNRITFAYFEGGFSCYEKSIEAIYNNAVLLAKIDKVNFYHPPTNTYFETDNKVNFVNKINDIFNEKYVRFKQIFGDFYCEVPPSRFYIEFKKKKQKSILYTILHSLTKRK